ncbi:MAG: NAD(P)-dependent alcohol dehydrogenase [Ilumatobacter sp.]|nr:NAD(P)-dependent alcohol dehydrogenase [Ilumatobacter sp.]
MQAVANDRYGAPEALAVRTMPVPTPADGEVLVAVAAAGIDRGTWHLTTGLPYAVRLAGFGLRRPKQPVAGMDLAGTVVAVGAGVTRLAPGDSVFGIGSGSWAEYACAKAEKVVLRPSAVAAEQAAAVPVSGLTALQAVRDAAKVQPGQRVLVLGASGGVGSFAVQIAAHLGAAVTGLASGAKADLVRSLGATEVIDYAREDALDGSVRYDAIIDTGGRNSLRRLRRALTPRGTLVIVGGEGGNRITGGFGRQLRAPLLSLFVSQTMMPMVSKERGGDIEILAGMLADGHLRAAVDRVVPLDQAATALADLAEGRVRGKAVVRVAD